MTRIAWILCLSLLLCGCGRLATSSLPALPEWSKPTNWFPAGRRAAPDEFERQAVRRLLVYGPASAIGVDDGVALAEPWLETEVRAMGRRIDPMGTALSVEQSLGDTGDVLTVMELDGAWKASQWRFSHGGYGPISAVDTTGTGSNPMAGRWVPKTAQWGTAPQGKPRGAPPTASAPGEVEMPRVEDVGDEDTATGEPFDIETLIADDAHADAEVDAEVHAPVDAPVHAEVDAPVDAPAMAADDAPAEALAGGTPSTPALDADSGAPHAPDTSLDMAGGEPVAASGPAPMVEPAPTTHSSAVLANAGCSPLFEPPSLRAAVSELLACYGRGHVLLPAMEGEPPDYRLKSPLDVSRFEYDRLLDALNARYGLRFAQEDE